ncbi:competence/damage-inducible protein A [Marinilactibacillus kalidii]|uniref:competence/damage-inducible protein A n=1 Tax=Marinilactibacillus kalidii TaxID=2820274 RepID=UPI001ABE0EAF|nr:competence/damage-inducible protein A [Marinilactibacillus kalidii]
MRAEVITVGTEILMGQIVNTNAAYLSKELSLLGIELYHQVTVGDNPDRIAEAIKTAEKRVDTIILTGGLGPTEDDITKSVLANYLGVDLVTHKPSEAKIIERHKDLDFKMPKNNLLQALILKGSQPLINDPGMAVGVFHQQGNHQYVLLPGPPNELKPMVENYLKEKLIEQDEQHQELLSKMLRIFGLTEAQLADKIENIIKNQSNPTVAIYASGGELKVRITAKGSTKSECEKMIDIVEREIAEEVGDYIYGYTDRGLASAVNELLIEQNKKITAAESLTGGTFLGSITSEEGASNVLEGGMVVYSTEQKINELGVSKDTIAAYGVVSGECAIEMAEKVMERFGSDIAVSLTGVAGPGRLEDHEPGEVWIGIAQRGKTAFAKEYRFKYDRNTNRERAVKNALNLTRRVLLDLSIENKSYIND